MAPLSPPPSLAPRDWSDEIAEVAEEFFDGFVTVTTAGAEGEYDPITDSYSPGGAPDVVILERPGRAQHLGRASELHDGNGWTAKTRYRFQCRIHHGDPDITKGMVVRFQGGRDPRLATLAFQVIRAINSSHAALRTIECQTEGVRVG